MVKPAMWGKKEMYEITDALDRDPPGAQQRTQVNSSWKLKRGRLVHQNNRHPSVRCLLFMKVLSGSQIHLPREVFRDKDSFNL